MLDPNAAASLSLDAIWGAVRRAHRRPRDALPEALRSPAGVAGEPDEHRREPVDGQAIELKERIVSRFMRALAALMALVIAALLAACGGGDDEESEDSESSGGEPVEIEFWHGQTQGPAELLQTMIDEFNKTHPDVVVSKDSGGVNSDRMLAKVTAGLQADNYPDIAYIYGSDLANLAGGEQLVDLSEAIDDGDIDWDRFVAAGTEAVTVDDAPRAVPAFIDNLAVVYNKEIFDEAGVDYPTDDWTWDDFLATAAGSTTPTPESPGSAGRGPATRTRPGESGR